MNNLNNYLNINQININVNPSDTVENALINNVLIAMAQPKVRDAVPMYALVAYIYVRLELMSHEIAMIWKMQAAQLLN